jgi:hypothetical protein
MARWTRNAHADGTIGRWVSTGRAVAIRGTLLPATTPRPRAVSEGVRYCGIPCS